MKCLSKGSSCVDIIASHDWPLGIEQHGNTVDLIRKKPFFRDEIQRNELGSLPNREVLDIVQPKWWFSAHLHVKFRATVTHNTGNMSPGGVPHTNATLIPSQVRTQSSAFTGTSTESMQQPETKNTETNKIDNVASSSGAAASHETNFHALESSCDGISDLTAQMTNFLALDKCLPRRHYLSVLHIECESPKEDTCLEYDLEWLAILRNTHTLNCSERKRVKIPETLVDVSKDDIEWVESRLKAINNSSRGNDGGFCRIPSNFQPTVPIYSDPCFQSPSMVPPLPIMGNPQTDFLLEILELDHIVTVPFDRSLTPEKLADQLRHHRSMPNNTSTRDENEIDINIDETSDMETEAKGTPVPDENEILLEDEDGDENEANSSPCNGATDVDSSKPFASTKKARLTE